ncbi:hypothetical protein VN23_11455 [Janthinobacterium sp. B9-8]|nr:hypothetical protein VN23_11455 [Janthinobacterium sp. B9-8]
MSEASSAAAARLSADEGAFVLVGAAFFSFVSWPFKKGSPPRWLPLQNQCAEGTKKVFLLNGNAAGKSGAQGKRLAHPTKNRF